MVPFDTASPMVTSGIRIGTAAITTRGLSSDDCHKVVDWIDEALQHKDDANRLRNIREQVRTIMEAYALYAGE